MSDVSGERELWEAIGAHLLADCGKDTHSIQDCTVVDAALTDLRRLAEAEGYRRGLDVLAEIADFETERGMVRIARDWWDKARADAQEKP